ncbi:MAG: hypothetical protein R6U51_08935 [Anaerolineales bacterium]
MKTIDLTPYKNDSPVLSTLKTLQGIIVQGWSWYQSRKSQQKLISILDDILSDECVLLRNVNLPKAGKPIPLVLVAPSGTTVINPKDKKGFFRAEGKKWEVMGQGEEYKPAFNNLIHETWVYQKTIEGYLKRHNFKAPNLNGALIFVSTETHIESISPIVKVIRADGIKNFARRLAISKPEFTDLDFRNLIKLLTKPALPEKKQEPAQKEVSSPKAEPFRFEEKLNNLVDVVNFTRQEWIIIGILIIFVILVLIALITLVLLTQ